MRDQVLHPYKTEGNVILRAFYSLDLQVGDAKTKDSDMHVS